jgi:hypothetical protein
VNYIDHLASAIKLQVPQERLPDGNTELLFRLYALLAETKGEHVSVEDVHDAWSVWMATEDPSHPSIRPFDELNPETRDEDEPFLAAIHEAVRRRDNA